MNDQERPVQRLISFITQQTSVQLIIPTDNDACCLDLTRSTDGTYENEEARSTAALDCNYSHEKRRLTQM